MLNPDHTLEHKFWLREALAGILPEQVLRRPKRGFEPPYQQWIEVLVTKYQPWLKDGYLAQRRIISPTFLKYLFRKTGNFNLKYRLIFLEVWCRNLLIS
jgi:asparagine synthase (glutamine-hydrolysing)